MSDCPYTVGFEAPGAPPPDDILLRVRFGAALKAGSEPGDIVVPLDPLIAAPAEVWRGRGRVERGWEGGVGVAHDGSVLVGHVSIPEEAARDADRAGEDAYRRIEQVLRALGYPYPLRVWNYLSGITDGEGDAERYRQFVVGRHRALSGARDFERHLPAATAIGTRGAGLLVYFLAAREPGLQVENPRQVSAFRYPRDYGPRSPSFSRATLKHWDDRGDLYVSGTASVVGHESRHIGDVCAQLREVKSNVDALLRIAAEHSGGRPFRAQHLKLYLKDARELGTVLPLARQLFGSDAPLLVLNGDICRTDLLLEVEGLYGTA